MKRSPQTIFFTLTLCVVLGASGVCSFAQTAERVAKAQPQHVLVAGDQYCQFDLELCALFEASLRASVEKRLPNVQFVTRDKVLNLLANSGFLPIDAYIADVLKAAASPSGAEILVTENLEWQVDGYELTSEVYDAAKHKKLEQFEAKIKLAVPPSRELPSVFAYPQSGVSVIIYRGKQSGPPAVQYPVCEKCPDPTYTPEAKSHKLEGTVYMLATITLQGTVERIGIITGLGDGLTERSVETVRNWHFKPAIGADGKPFAARVPIEVNFHLLLR